MSSECFPITVLPEMSQIYRDYLAMADSARRCGGAAVVWSGTICGEVDGEGCVR